MITPEEMARFELLFEELKLLLLSESEDKFNNALSIIIKLSFIKNGGNKNGTARDLGVSVKTVRSHIKDYDVKKDMIDMHLNMLVCNRWFANLPVPEKVEIVSDVMNYYESTETQVQSVQ